MNEENVKTLIKNLSKEYYKNGYGFLLKRKVKAILEENKDNFYLFKEASFAKEMVKGLGRRLVADFVNDAINSCDSTKIYNCGYMVGSVYPEFLQQLVEAIIKTEDANAIGCFAVIVKGVTKYQFLEMAQALVDLEDCEVIVDFSCYVCGTETCFNSFNILDKFVKMIKAKHNLDFEAKIVNKINSMRAETKGMQSYAIPYGWGVCTEMLTFVDALWGKRFGTNYDEDLMDITIKNELNKD